MDPVERRSIEYPTKRQKHTACLVGNSIYYIGGEVPRETTLRLNEIWKYDTGSFWYPGNVSEDRIFFRNFL